MGIWKIIFSVVLEMSCGGNGTDSGNIEVPVAEMLDFVIFSWTSVKESSVSSRSQKSLWLESQLLGHISLSVFIPFGRYYTAILSSCQSVLASRRRWAGLLSDLQKQSAWGWEMSHECFRIRLKGTSWVWGYRRQGKQHSLPAFSLT